MRERRRRRSASPAARVVVAADAASRIGAATEWLGAYPPSEQVVVVAPSWEACDELVRAVAGARGALFGVTRWTLSALAGALATPALARAGRVPTAALALDAVAARAVHAVRAERVLDYFDAVAGRPGFPRAVARTTQELRMSAIPTARLRGLPRLADDLAVLATRIERELEAAGLADRAAVFEAAVAAAGEGPAPLLVGWPLVLLDVPLRAAREIALVAALARRAPAVLATAPAGDARTITSLESALGCQATTAEPPPGPAALRAVQQHLFDSPEPPAGTLDPSVVVRSWPGEARECIEIARQVRDEAARGTPFDRMAVLLHAPESYTAHLEEAFRHARIPAYFARGTTEPDPAGRAVLALLACAAERLSARRFAEYLSLAQVPDPAARAAAEAGEPWVPPDHELLGPPAPAASAADEARDDTLPVDPEGAAVVEGTVRAPWRWEQLLVEASVIGGEDRWARRLAGLEHELGLQRHALDPEDEARTARAERALADVGHLRDFALPLIATLAALPVRAHWREWLARLRALAARTLRDPTGVLATLAELEPMAPVGPVDLDEVRLVLGPRLRELRRRPAGRRYGAVLVAPIEAGRGLAFDVVFVPGLAERLFPRKIVEDPILLDAHRLAVAPAEVLTTQADRGADERLALRIAVGAARGRLVLSFPRLDLETARPRVPSFYTLETLRAAEGQLPGFEQLAARARGSAEVRVGWPAPEEPAHAISDAEYDLALLRPLLDADPETTAGTAHYLLTANPHLARALRSRARRWLHRWTPADGLVDPDDLARAALVAHQLAARSYSPTALQNFAACPYRFFLQAIHRLRPREDPVAIEALDPLTRGALIHEVQFALLSKLRADGLLPLDPGRLDRALTLIDGVLDAVAHTYAERLAPAIARVWDGAIDLIRADLREWLRRSAEADDGWVPHRFELSFGLADRDRDADPASVPDPVAVVGGLRLRGAIDLVERHRRGTVRATDHKTGKVVATHGVVVGGGEILQPVLYALACERLLPEPVEAGRLYYCTATGGYEERTVPLDDHSRALAGEVVAAIERALRDGFLPAAPRARTCRYCDYRPVCGPHEELRVTRKPRARLADLERVRSLP